MNSSVHSKRPNRASSVRRRQARAFTLTELLVVLGTLAVLALLLVPALAGSKIDTWRLQCQNNLKQLQVGFQLFAQDHGDVLPPAGDQASIGGQLTWDAYIHHYFGDTNSDASWTLGVLFSGSSPTMETIELCPADWGPMVSWAAGPPGFARRSYAMNCTGGGASGYGATIEVNDGYPNRTYLLPDLNNTSLHCHGVGIYWTSGASAPDWNAKGYKTSVVKDPDGTILLAEVSSSMQIVGNIWPCCCCGPQTTDGSANGWGNLFQIDTAAPTAATKLAQGGYSEGQQLYQAHWGRFNYLFHDGHVAALKIEQTVGTGTTTAPKGMWTVTPGD